MDADDLWDSGPLYRPEPVSAPAAEQPRNSNGRFATWGAPVAGYLVDNEYQGGRYVRTYWRRLEPGLVCLPSERIAGPLRLVCGHTWVRLQPGEDIPMGSRFSQRTITLAGLFAADFWIAVITTYVLDARYPSLELTYYLGFAGLTVTIWALLTLTGLSLFRIGHRLWPKRWVATTFEEAYRVEREEQRKRDEKLAFQNFTRTHFYDSATGTWKKHNHHTLASARQAMKAEKFWEDPPPDRETDEELDS